MIRHRMDAVSLVTGLVFAAVAGTYLLAAQAAVDVDARWVLPMAMIGLGLGGVAGAISTARRQRVNMTDDTATTADTDEPTLQSE